MIPTSDACVPSQKTLAERTCPWKMLTSRGSSKRGELRKGQEKHRVAMAVGEVLFLLRRNEKGVDSAQLNFLSFFKSQLLKNVTWMAIYRYLSLSSST